jgi:hypothetical protein
VKARCVEPVFPWNGESDFFFFGDRWATMKWAFGKKKTPEEQKNDKPICVKLDECLFVKRHGDCPEFRMKRYHQFYCNGYLSGSMCPPTLLQ